MPIPYNPLQRTRYVLLADRELPEQERAVFILRPPRIRDRDRLQGRIIEGLEPVLDEDGEPEIDENGQPKHNVNVRGMMASGLMTDILLCTLEGWENWRDGPECKKDGHGLVKLESLEYLAPADQMELSTEAMKLMSLTTQDRD